MSSMVPFRKALLILLGSLIMSCACFALGWYYWQHIQNKRGHDFQFTIVALAQASKSPTFLKSGYLAELLELSADRPTNLYQFNAKEAEQRLLRCALIKEATLTKFKPGTLFIEYSLREPIAFLGDFSNTAIDKEGVLIPFKPFFTPKNLPEISVGLISLGEEARLDEEWGKWGRPLKGPRAQLALDIFGLIQSKFASETLLLKKLDVSRAYALSYGQRQIVLQFEDRWPKGDALIVTPLFLRLSTARYEQELAYFLKLREQLHEQIDPQLKGRIQLPGEVIDLRVPQLAFVHSLEAI